jgi:MFS family permease
MSQKSFLGLSKNVKNLGWVSLFNDISSEMIYPLLPLFLTQVLGAGLVFVGLIEGIAESISSFFKLFSGWLSDRFQRRKGIILFGYSLASLTRPFMGLTTSAYHVLFLRFFDRVGKGTRSSPRDALLSQSCNENERGKAFGFQRAMDHAGAMTGPLIASLLMATLTQNLRVIFYLAAIPAAFCVWVLYRGVSEVRMNHVSVSTPLRLHLKSWDRKFKYFLLIIFLFTLGNSSDAFLLLRAKDLGIDMVSIPILWSFLHLSKTIFSIPGGTLSDRIGRRRVMIIAWTIYGLVYLGFAFASNAYHIWLLFFIYGIFYGFAEGTERAWVADLVEESKRGTAYGAYHFFIGIATLPASLLMGLLWKTIGIQWAFSFGAGMALIAALLAVILMGEPTKNSNNQIPNSK